VHHWSMYGWHYLINFLIWMYDMMHLTDLIYELLVTCRFLLNSTGYFGLADSWRLTWKLKVGRLLYTAKPVVINCKPFCQNGKVVSLKLRSQMNSRCICSHLHLYLFEGELSLILSFFFYALTQYYIKGEC